MLQDEDFDSDTSDEDFVPDGVESDDEPVSGVEEEVDETENDDDKRSLAKKSTKTKKNKKKRPGSLFAQKPDSTETGEEQDKELKAVNEEQNKKKTDDIWADFLADVEDKPSPPPKPKSSSWAALLGNKKSPSSSNKITSKQETSLNRSEVKKNDAPVKPSTVKITQVFEFAGEEVRVEKEVDADSAEAKAALTSLKSGAANDSKSTVPGLGGTKRPGGLSSVVGLLDNKKQKLTTLEKTKLDWSSFKSEEGLNEELEKHKKSKDGYLDKKAFLERADVRQFEIERAMRMNKRSHR
ncbi:craniofacial development protein 1 [Procambarus clarkii]|uniref:craniofacial development protein 1 n=1 Tax=Procambarus clarkii TaxID=6728 RepID=UPI001E6711E7|nr:craniofacial development protein 1-like [Procambarus clarkii]